jgi:hypothetical protein
MTGPHSRNHTHRFAPVSGHHATAKGGRDLDIRSTLLPQGDRSDSPGTVPTLLVAVDLSVLVFSFIVGSIGGILWARDLPTWELLFVSLICAFGCMGCVWVLWCAVKAGRW